LAKQASKKHTSGRKATTTPAAHKAAGKKSTAKKPPAKKPETKKPESKKPATKKPVPKQPATKAPLAKQPGKQPSAKDAKTKAAAKPVEKQAPARKPSAKAAPTEKVPAKQAPTKKAAAPKAPAAPPEAKPGDAKSGRKGITVVAPKPAKKPRAAKPIPAIPALSGSILGMGLSSGRPLIPSGPKAPSTATTSDDDAATAAKTPKSPFTKRQLDRYQEVLILKRRELLGDIDSMENEALKSQSGSLSHLPQHMAEQGSETYEQSLSLDLAAADRALLREIDAAIQRIIDRIFGLCERTGKPITKERLAELPWARYSIEAAREMERHKK